MSWPNPKMLFLETPRNPESSYPRPYPGTKEIFCIKETTLNLLPEVEVSNHPTLALASCFQRSCPAPTLRASDREEAALPHHAFKAGCSLAAAVFGKARRSSQLWRIIAWLQQWLRSPKAKRRKRKEGGGRTAEDSTSQMRDAIISFFFEAYFWLLPEN